MNFAVRNNHHLLRGLMIWASGGFEFYLSLQVNNKILVITSLRAKEMLNGTKP